MPSTLMERIEHKKENVKLRLNDIVDDLFAYLASELSRLAVPPDRVQVITNQISVETQKRTEPPEEVNPEDTAVEVKEEAADGDTVELPKQVVNNNNNNTSHSLDSPPSVASTATCTASVSLPNSGSPVDSVLCLASTSSVGVSGISLHVNEDHDEDEEFMDEHSDSDCDCEQCMGVPICKVDIDEEHDPADRPAKKQKTAALTHDAIADFHDDDGEQCSATFKTISIKCSQDDCPSMFKNKVERNQHLLHAHNIQPYTCLMKNCNQGFDNVRQYGEHVNVEHKEVTVWPCNRCTKVCTDHRLLCRHIYFYHQEGRFKCRKSKCSFVAPYRIDVRKHSQLHTEMYACQFGCGKSFSHTHHRKRHERIHLRLKPFRCKLCQYCSEARSTVIRHIRLRHFNLPLTLKQQNELNIVDNRDPRDYMEILSELMN